MRAIFWIIALLLIATANAIHLPTITGTGTVRSGVPYGNLHIKQPIYTSPKVDITIEASRQGSFRNLSPKNGINNVGASVKFKF